MSLRSFQIRLTVSPHDVSFLGKKEATHPSMGCFLPFFLLGYGHRSCGFLHVPISYDVIPSVPAFSLQGSRNSSIWMKICPSNGHMQQVDWRVSLHSSWTFGFTYTEREINETIFGFATRMRVEPFQEFAQTSQALLRWTLQKPGVVYAA